MLVHMVGGVNDQPLLHAYQRHSCSQIVSPKESLGWIEGKVREHRLLCNQEHIDGAKVELVEEGLCSKAIVRWMLASIELKTQSAKSQQATLVAIALLTITVLPLYCTM
jgi:hypothetical protein